VYIFQNKRVSILRYQPGTVAIVLLVAIGCLIYSTTVGLIIGAIAAAMTASLWATGQLRIPIYVRGDLKYFQVREGPEGVKTTNHKAVDHFGPTKTHLYRVVPVRPEDTFSLPYRETNEWESEG
jgi:hypothetical protein